jgi:hypothetical protein
VDLSPFVLRCSVSSFNVLIGDLASTAMTKPSLARVVTAVKSLTGSKDSFLKVCVAAAIVELPGAIRIV